MLDHLPDLAKDVVMKFAAKPPRDTLQRFPLHRAAQRGDLAECQRLIAEGHDVNALDEDGEMPLHFSAWYGQVEVTRFLVNNGADVNSASATYPDGTPLQWAAETGQVEITRILEEAGAHDPMMN